MCFLLKRPKLQLCGTEHTFSKLTPNGDSSLLLLFVFNLPIKFIWFLFFKKKREKLNLLVRSWIKWCATNFDNASCAIWEYQNRFIRFKRFAWLKTGGRMIVYFVVILSILLYHFSLCKQMKYSRCFESFYVFILLFDANHWKKPKQHLFTLLLTL